MTNAQPRVRIERVEHVLVIEMCRADKRNAIDRVMADALDEALTLLDRDDDLRVGVLAADGPVFSAGSDLTAGGDYYTERGGEYGSSGVVSANRSSLRWMARHSAGASRSYSHVILSLRRKPPYSGCPRSRSVSCRHVRDCSAHPGRCP